jgi:hypothetical protein
VSDLSNLVLPSSRQIGVRRLARELKKLVGWGLSEQKLRELEVVQALPNVRRRAGEGVIEPESLGLAAYELILEAVATIEDPIEQQVLTLLLALDDKARGYGRANDRRERALKILRDAVDKRKWDITVATWRRDYEVRYLEKLAVRLLRWPGLGIADSNTQPSQEAALNLQTVALEYYPDPRRDYKTLSIHTTYRFLSGRIPYHQETEKTVQALVDAVELWREGASYTVANEAVELEVVAGAKIERQLEGNFHGFRYWDLRFPSPLAAGETHTLRIRKIIKDRATEPLPYFTFSAAWPVEVLTMRIEFAHDCVPHRVARIVTPTVKIYEEPYLNRVMDIQDATVETAFLDLQEGMSYGFVWMW